MDADFLIIGGGIAGISAAARMSELGSVIVLEAEEALAHHASGRSAALFEPRYGAPAVVGLSMASEAYFRSVPGVKKVKLGAQTHALGFYEHLGFTAFGDEFDDAGIPHREMVLLL